MTVKTENIMPPEDTTSPSTASHLKYPAAPEHAPADRKKARAANQPAAGLPLPDALPTSRRKTARVRTLSAITLVVVGAVAWYFFSTRETARVPAVSASATVAPAPQYDEVASMVQAAQMEATPNSAAANTSAVVVTASLEALFMQRNYPAVIAAAKQIQCTSQEQNMLGIAYYNVGQFAESVQAFKTLEDMLPNDAVVKGNLADALLAAGQHSQALDKYRQAQALAPNDLSYRKNIVKIEQQSKPLPNHKPATEKKKSNEEDYSPRHIDPVMAEAYTATDLRNAVDRSDVSMVDAILGQGFDVNRRDASGQTLLIVAINNNDLNMARHLILHGADPNLPGYDGYLPLMRAKASSRPNQELIRYLKSAGAMDQYPGKR